MQTTPPTKCFGKVEVLICFVIGQGVDIYDQTMKPANDRHYGSLWYIMVYCQGETVYGLRQ